MCKVWASQRPAGCGPQLDDPAPLLVQLAKEVSCGAFQGDRGRCLLLQRLSSDCIAFRAASEESIASPSSSAAAAASSFGGIIQRAFSSSCPSPPCCGFAGRLGAEARAAAGAPARGGAAGRGGPKWPLEGE